MEIPIEEARKEDNIRDIGLLVIDTVTDEVQSHVPNNDKQWTIM